MPITPGSCSRKLLKCPAARPASVVQVCPRGGTFWRSSSQISQRAGALSLGGYWVPQAVQMNASISLLRIFQYSADVGGGSRLCAHLGFDANISWTAAEIRLMHLQKKLRSLAAMLAAALLLLPPQPASAQSNLTTVPTVVISVTVSIWPAIVAKEKGLFAEQGLNVDFIDSGSSSRSIQQVAAGSAEIGSSSLVDTVRAIGA